jgi:hypothetical protein
MAATECGYLRKAVDATYPAAMRTFGIAGLHAQHDSRYLILRDYGSALIADELRLLANYLKETTAALRVDFGTRNEGPGHALLWRWRDGRPLVARD